ncbi:MAG: AAA family ATPase, partial [Muribaculaceae bacterium]|nr:AAA family ATPase [Muribaculaceae bacterium]
MFYRTATRKLEQWKDSPYRMPLIVRGARQVGKTTLINEFGKSYSNYRYINLDDDSRAREVLEMNIDLESKVRTLFAILGKSQIEGDTLIFIDEIQNSPRTIGLM